MHINDENPPKIYIFYFALIVEARNQYDSIPTYISVILPQSITFKNILTCVNICLK